jgi:hypothetical protein
MKSKWLLQLADLLDKLPRRQFNYNHFVNDNWNGKASLCGTAACAGGWATTMRPVRRMGLRLQLHPYHFSQPNSAVHIVPTAANGLTKQDIICKGIDRSFHALGYVFDISGTEAQYLFLPNRCFGGDLPISPLSHATPKQVARHIRRFVEWKQPQVVA